MPRGNWIDDVVSIPDHARLWRGVVSSQINTNADGQQIPSEGALRSEEVSVNIGDETTVEWVINKARARGVEWRLWQFTAGEARGLGCIVDRDPEPDDPSHAVVLNADGPGEKRLTGRQAGSLRRGGQWAS